MLTVVFHRNLTRLKITQLEKAYFVKMNMLKLIQVELFQFFNFMCVAVNAPKLFCMAHLVNNDTFYTILTFQNLFCSQSIFLELSPYMNILLHLIELSVK